MKNNEESKFKVRENRARRQLHRQGFTLKKNRSRNPQTWNNGYMIVNTSTNMLEAGYTGNGFDMDLDEVETFVKE